MSDTRSQQEPSMEEILASIRRIISEDNEPEAQAEKAPPARPAPEPEPAPPAMDEDVLELTQMVQEDGSVVNVDEDAWEQVAAPEPEPEPVKFEPAASEPEEFVARHETAPTPGGSYEDGDLVSEQARTAASAAFAHLASSIGGRGIALYGGGPTIEDIVKDMLRPMLKDWLDENLPPLVERLVQREIEKMVRRAQGGL